MARYRRQRYSRRGVPLTFEEAQRFLHSIGWSMVKDAWDHGYIIDSLRRDVGAQSYVESVDDAVYDAIFYSSRYAETNRERETVEKAAADFLRGRL